jgi:hypothetical protein
MRSETPLCDIGPEFPKPEDAPQRLAPQRVRYLFLSAKESSRMRDSPARAM